MLSPNSVPTTWNPGVRTPPGREAVRAYVTYVLETLERLEQAGESINVNPKGTRSEVPPRSA